MMGKILTLSVVLAAVGHSAMAAAQHSGPAPAPAMVQQQLGTVIFPNSGNEAAQAPFIDGVKRLHNFDYPGAAKSFQAAQKADPDMVLAYWGEAMSYNETLWSNQSREAALQALGRLAPTREERAAKAKTDRERAWLDAVETLYGTGSKFERDEAYADRMDALAKRYDDTEAIVFDALATLGRSHGTRDIPNYERAGAMLVPLFETHRDHPGIAHYIIHSYDDPVHARQGLAAARVYDGLAPDSPHAQHMVSHIFLALGMWPDVERANLQAIEAAIRVHGADRRAAACGHAGLWLAYARLQQGEDVSSQLDDCKAAAAESLAAANEIPVIGFPESATGSAAEIGVRRGIEAGVWDAPLDLPQGKLNYARFIYLYGEVLSARHDAAKAKSAFEGMVAAHAILSANFRKEFPDDSQSMPWNDLALAEAEAVTMLATGHRDGGIAALRRVAARERALPAVFGPPPLLKPSWEMLGDELLALGDKTGAAAAYRESLKLQPGRRLSVAGLAKASF